MTPMGPMSSNGQIMIMRTTNVVKGAATPQVSNPMSVDRKTEYQYIKFRLFGHESDVDLIDKCVETLCIDITGVSHKISINSLSNYDEVYGKKMLQVCVEFDKPVNVTEFQRDRMFSKMNTGVEECDDCNNAFKVNVICHSFEIVCNEFDDDILDSEEKSLDDMISDIDGIIAGFLQKRNFIAKKENPDASDVRLRDLHFAVTLFRRLRDSAHELEYHELRRRMDRLAGMTLKLMLL